MTANLFLDGSSGSGFGLAALAGNAFTGSYSGGNTVRWVNVHLPVVREEAPRMPLTGQLIACLLVHRLNADREYPTANRHTKVVSIIVRQLVQEGLLLAPHVLVAI